MTDKNSILAKLKTAIPLDIRILEAAGSTNSVAKDAARSGAAENTVIIAERQTAGRGRGSHTFFSPESTGIYMSILLRPHFEYALCPLITTAAAAATARAIEELSGKKALIKWINDIFVGSGKVCGILTEASANTS